MFVDLLFCNNILNLMEGEAQEVSYLGNYFPVTVRAYCERLAKL